MMKSVEGSEEYTRFQESINETVAESKTSQIAALFRKKIYKYRIIVAWTTALATSAMLCLILAATGVVNYGSAFVIFMVIWMCFCICCKAISPDTKKNITGVKFPDYQFDDEVLHPLFDKGQRSDIQIPIREDISQSLYYSSLDESTAATSAATSAATPHAK